VPSWVRASTTERQDRLDRGRPGPVRQQRCHHRDLRQGRFRTMTTSTTGAPVLAPPQPAAAPKAVRKFTKGAGGVGPVGLGIATLWLSIIVFLPLAAIVFKVAGRRAGHLLERRDRTECPCRAAHHGGGVAHRRGDQRGAGHAGGLGVGPGRFPRKGLCQRADRPAVGAANHRGQHRAALAVRSRFPGGRHTSARPSPRWWWRCSLSPSRSWSGR